MRDWRNILIGIAILVTGTGQASAQTLRAEISSRKCAIDEVLTIQIVVNNPKQATTPMPEKSNDFEIRLTPGQAQPAVFSRQSWNNGRFSSSVQHTYTFDIRPLRTGRLTVPPFVLKGAGTPSRTQPFIVHVGKSGGTSNLMCKIVTDSKTVYVGEPGRTDPGNLGSPIPPARHRHPGRKRDLAPRHQPGLSIRRLRGCRGPKPHGPQGHPHHRKGRENRLLRLYMEDNHLS